LVGAEALVRWQHEDRTISPGAFIPIAEDSGLIVPVGEWVVAETCRQLKRWREQGLPRLPVAVNVSPRQFNYPDFFQRLVSILDQHRVKPEEIELEITESALMEDGDGRVTRLVANLKQAGFKLAIDDFGTGYSSLAMLHRLPIHKLKIDRSFVVAAEKDDQAASIVQAIISMGQALKVEVLAEGVETSAQRDMLLARHCHLIQGYFYGMPMAAKELVRFMVTNGQPVSALHQAKVRYVETSAMLQ
jgi:EAL domain-containing protein (putative c-di-GMP-specific phosphodiesterase class I)